MDHAAVAAVAAVAAEVAAVAAVAAEVAAVAVAAVAAVALHAVLAGGDELVALWLMSWHGQDMQQMLRRLVCVGGIPFDGPLIPFGVVFARHLVVRLT
jgi:hypothetical protein